MAQSRSFDAAVVGLGAAGCWAAKTLTERGLRVAAFDAGRQLTPDDLPREIPPAGYLRRVFARNRAIQSRSVSYHPALSHLYADDRRHPYTTRGGDPFLWIRGHQVGGRLHTWARMALRLSDDDFRRAADDGHGLEWPLVSEDLAPYYDRIEQFHGLSGHPDGLAEVPDGRFSEVKDLTEPAQLFRAKIEGRWPERRVIQPRVLGQEPGPIPAPLRAALATERLELIAQGRVSRVLVNQPGDRAVGLEWVDAGTGQRTELHADLIVLCASSIESVRILLNSRTDQHQDGLGNSHGQLGRHMLDHNFAVATGQSGESYRKFQGSFERRPSNPLDLAADLDFYLPDFCRTLEHRTFVRGFGIQGMLTPTRFGLAAFGEMLPHPDNRVTLSNRTDALGIPIANISMRRRENDLEMIAAQLEQIRQVAEAADLEIRMPLPALLRGLLWKAVGPQVGVLHLGLAIHETGGARMGADPQTSVLNHQNQLWDIPNLLVTDGACFPNTGCQNPTLTIMALTARACELATPC